MNEKNCFRTEPEVLERVLSKLKLDTSRPPIWEPHYPLENSDFQNGYTCSCCGKLSFLKKEICDGCNSVMTNYEVKNGR